MSLEKKFNHLPEKIDSGVIYVLSTFLISRFIIFIIGHISDLIVAKSENIALSLNPASNSSIFFKWDSGWYYSIVAHGYYFSHNEESSIGFMPLYPLLIRIISWPIGHPILIGFIISNLTILFAGIYLYKLIRLDFSSEIAEKSVLFMFIMPVSFFFSIFYTEGPFMFLTVSSFYYARKKNWILASLLAGLSSITRPFGILITLPILIEYLEIGKKPLKQALKEIKADILAILLVPLPLIIFMLYQFFKFGDAIAFLHAQQIGWKRSITLLKPFTEGYFFNHPLFYQILILSSAITGLMLLFYLFFTQQKISYKIYALLMVSIYLSTGMNEIAIPRYLMTTFPLYISLAIIANKNRILNYLIEFISIALLALMTILFVNGYWIV